MALAEFISHFHPNRKRAAELQSARRLGQEAGYADVAGGPLGEKLADNLKAFNPNHDQALDAAYREGHLEGSKQ